MKTRIPNIVLQTLLCCVLLSCNDDSPVIPLPPPCNDITLCDTCDTGAPRNPVDSSLNLPPPLYYTVQFFRRSPTSNIYAGSSAVDGLYNIWNLYNNFLYNPETKEITIIPGSSWVEWSSDGKKILARGGFDYFLVIDFPSLTYKTILQKSAGEPHWSLDNEYIFFQKNAHVWKIKPDETEVHKLPVNLSFPQQVDDSLIVGISNDTLYFFNMLNEKKYPCGFGVPNENQQFWGFHTGLDISPNRKYALGEVISKRGKRDEAGLYFFDFENITARKVLPQQYWGQPYQARWSSNSTFFATYYCRKDSAAMVYEFDLNGKTLRQMTFKEQRFYP